MIAVVERYGHGLHSTLGVLLVPTVNLCYTLEDESREHKVHSETRIPGGVFTVELRTTGGFHERYRARFPDIHRGMLWLRNVPGFEYILIHCGNTAEDTAGCILVGEVPRILPSGEFVIDSSVSAYRRVYPVLAEAASQGKLQIEVRNRKVWS